MNKKYENYLSYPIGLLVAFFVFSVVLLLLGYDPIASLASIPDGAFGTPLRASETLIRFIPLLLTSLAFSIALKARFLNIGIEGQLYIGALMAYLVGAQLGGIFGIVSIPIIMTAGFMGGVLWLALPLFMKIKLEINEIFPTVVMNFIAILIIAWLTSGPLKKEGSNNPVTSNLPESTWFPEIFPDPVLRLHVGLFLVILLAFLVYIILFKTTLGYRIRAVGQNPRAAKHGGINVTQSVIAAGLLSGGIAGLAGMMEVFGIHHFLTAGFSPGFGFQGIAVAALGNFHPIGIIFSSFFFAVLQIGGESMQRSVGVPVDMIIILQAVLVLSVLIVQKWITVRKLT
ncbi:MAG TPA: ABC transporter permease [bacterium]|nr:MAG: hypothetical protein HeimC3_51680 [Candidatus Heimdallarchaeota archaeon LC_3]HEC65837.1 ABC transporter permease [bacterium]